MHKQTSRRAPSQSSFGLAAIALAAALWALGAGVASDLFASGVKPIELAEARAVVAAAGLALFPAARRGLQSSGTPEATRAGYLSVIALGACIALVNAAYYVAIDHLPVAIAIVLQYTAPAMVVAWTALAMRRRPSFEVLAGVGLAVGGVFLVSGAVSESVGSTDAIGIAAGLASAILFASSTLVGDRVIGTFGPAGGLLRGCLVASGLWICWQMTQGWPETLFDPSNLPRVVYVGLLATAAPFLLYFWGVQRVKVERAAIVATLEPVLAAVVAWTWLGQTLTFMQMLGGALVIAAILLIQTREHEPVLAPDV